jgi:hypothetical protein
MQLLVFMAHANWIIAGAAAMLTCTTWIRFGLPVQYNALLFIFLSTLLVYSFQRLLKFFYLKLNPDSYNWCVIHYKFLIAQCIIALLASVTFVGDFPVIVIYGLLTAAVFSLLYLFVSPFNLKITGLRHLPFLKSIFTSIVWAVVTAIVPLLFFSHEQVSKSEMSWLYIEHMLFIYCLIIPFDIRDLDIDHARLNTLPQLVGEKNAKITGAAILLVFLLVSEIFNAPRPFPVLVTFGISALLILTASRHKGVLYYSYILDGMIYLYGLGFLAANWLIN